MFGVRANSVEVGALVRELFVDRLVPGADPPGNLSLLLAPPMDDGAQWLHRLYVTHEQVVRTGSASRALDALWHELDVRDVEVTRRRMALEATVIVRAGAAYVLPPWMRWELMNDQRRWQAEGFQLVDRRFVGLDPAAGTVTIDPSRLRTPWLEADRWAATAIHHRTERPRPVGTMKIAGWVRAPASGTLAGRVIDAAGQVADRPTHDGVAMLEGLSALLAGLPDVVGSAAQDLRSQLTAG